MNKNFTPPKSKSNKYFKRFLAFLFSIAFWSISIVFNVKGFNLQVPDAIWMAITMGIGITILQFIGSSSGNWMIILLCIMSYFYAIWTDVIGIEQISNIPTGWLLMFAFLVEVAPEKAMIWAINPDSRDGDWLWKIYQLVFHPHYTPPVRPVSTPSNRPMPKPVYNTPLNDTMRQRMRQVSFREIPPDGFREMPQ